MDALAHLMRVEIADLRCLAHAQIIRARRACRAARHGDDREIRLRFENDRHLLRSRRIVQMIVEDARIPRHRIAVEDARLLHIFGAVRKEQRAARIARLHLPAVHHARGLLRDAPRGHARIAEDRRDAATNAPLRRTARTHHRRPVGRMRRGRPLRRRKEQRGAERRRS